MLAASPGGITYPVGSGLYIQHAGERHQGWGTHLEGPGQAPIPQYARDKLQGGKIPPAGAGQAALLNMVKKNAVGEEPTWWDPDGLRFPGLPKGA